MSDYMNTVDLIGDEALTDSIIDRSITEIVDDQAIAIGNYVFSNCKKLTKAVFLSAKSVGYGAFQACNTLVDVTLPLVTSLDTYAFYICATLHLADFPQVTSIGVSAFRYGSLTTLILRSETLCTLANVNAIQNTPIASGTGYVYVPRALLSDYQSATNWSTYAAKIRAIEDYPEITGG